MLKTTLAALVTTLVVSAATAEPVRPFNVTREEVMDVFNDLVAKYAAEGSLRSESSTIEEVGCHDHESYGETCQFHNTKYALLRVTGEPGEPIDTVIMSGVPFASLKESPETYDLLHTGLRMFSTRFRSDPEGADRFLQNAFAQARKNGTWQTTLDGREFSFDKDGEVFVFTGEGDECDGC